MEYDDTEVSTSAKQLKSQEEFRISTDHSTGYRIKNFFTVFLTISNLVKWAKSNGSVKFQVASQRALGFKVVKLCDNCTTQYVPSYLFVGTGFGIEDLF